MVWLAVGILPDFSHLVLRLSGDYQTRQLRVYDLQEPFGWIADVAVMDVFEGGDVTIGEERNFVGSSYANS